MVASVISAALGEVINASIIITMVLLSVALNFIQTYRSQIDATRGYQGRRSSLRSALAPGLHIPRLRRWQAFYIYASLAHALVTFCAKRGVLRKSCDHTANVPYSGLDAMRPRLAITARSSSGSTGFARCT